MKWQSIIAAVGIIMAPVSLVGLGACVGATVAAEAPVYDVAASGDHVVLGGARAFAAAELGYITAADAVGRLVDVGLIRGAMATQVRGWNAEARKLLVTGKASVDLTEKARIAARLFGITDRLQSLRK